MQRLEKGMGLEGLEFHGVDCTKWELHACRRAWDLASNVDP